MEFLIIFVIVAAVAAIVADRKGRSAGGWFFLTLFVMPAILVLLALPQLEAAPGTPDAMKTCPACAERVKEQARVCRFCGHEFTTPRPITYAPPQKLGRMPWEEENERPYNGPVDWQGRPRRF